MIHKPFVWLYRRIRNLVTSDQDSVFMFWDGVKWREADPIAAHRQFIKKMGDNWEEDVGGFFKISKIDPKKIDAPMRASLRKEYLEKSGRIIDMTREVFDIPPLEGNMKQTRGLTDNDVFKVFLDFLFCVGKYGDEYLPLAATPTPTELHSSSQCPEDVGSPSEKHSDSTSTGIEFSESTSSDS